MRHAVPPAMMAFDSRSTPDRPHLSDTTLAELRDAVRTLWLTPSRVDGRLESAMGALVRESRERTLRAEDVLVEVKALLSAMPELEDPERRLEGVRFREQLVTRCIKAYYGKG